VWGWLWSSDPDGEALFLFHFGPCCPRRVSVWGWLWSSDPDGEALFLLYVGTRCPRRVWVLGWLWSSDPDGEALFLLHFGPTNACQVIGPTIPSTITEGISSDRAC
jgi:hypothetical protein